MRGDDIKAVTIYVKFRIGDVVYMKTAREKWPGMVTGYNHRPLGTMYMVSWPDCTDSQHYDIELTTEFIPTFDSENVDD